MNRPKSKKPNAAPPAPSPAVPQYGPPDPLPDHLAARLRRAKAQLESAHAIHQHEVDEAARELGVMGVYIDIDKGLFARPIIKSQSI